MSKLGEQFKETLMDDVRFVIEKLEKSEQQIADLTGALSDCVTSIEINIGHIGLPFEQEAKYGRKILSKYKYVGKDVRDE